MFDHITPTITCRAGMLEEQRASKPGQVNGLVSRFIGGYMCFLFFHDWSKWATYIQDPPHGFAQKEERQRRVCKRCGKVQDVSIREI